MALFDRFHLTLEEAEAALHRPLTGDPSRGEKAILAAINGGRYNDARRLAESPGLRQDAKDLFLGHLTAQAERWQAMKAWKVSIPLPVFDEYAREARVNRTSISRCLTAAIKRDYERRLAVAEPVDTLRAEVRAYHATQLQFLEEMRGLVGRLGTR